MAIQNEEKIWKLVDAKKEDFIELSDRVFDTPETLYLEVDENYRARVMTWWSTISFGSLVFGGIIIGFLGDIIGINYAVSIMMLVGTAAALFLFIFRRQT